MKALGDGIWRWTLRHPEWHPRTEFGAEVGCYAVHHGGGTVLIDPLLDDPVTEELDAVVDGDVVVAITIPYHVRSALEAVERWGGVIAGHADIARRLPERAPLIGDEDLPLGLRMHRLTRGKERPLELPGVRALAFGDRVVGIDGGLRVWLDRPLTDKRREWFRKTGAPSLAHLLEIECERVLVTHGEPVLRNGRTALADALDGDPWYHRPS
ncbi:MAG TPA: hypothetical protein VFG79_10550 [Solirubrobacter sp.]|nr:hypothetical protein [Solirubrobacter sp.]